MAVREWNKTERTITFTSGWILEFTAYDSEQKAKQGKRQYAFFNEANGVTWQIFRQIASRTRIRVFCDYNPSSPFWAHEKLIGTTAKSNDLSKTVELIISDHRHNPFLTEQQHAEIEGIKDPELWRVYARGLTGNLSGLIYTNWKVIPDSEYPWTEDGRFGGIDYGYTNDPTAAVNMVKIANNIYVHELCYQPAMTPVQINTLFKSSNFTEETPIYSEHDPDMIRQLRGDPFNLFVIAAHKGPGSIKAGISKVKEYNIFYTESSKNIDFERKRYMWMKDPASGKFMNVPSEGNEHLLDAIRFGIYSHFYRNNS